MFVFGKASMLGGLVALAVLHSASAVGVGQLVCKSYTGGETARFGISDGGMNPNLGTFSQMISVTNYLGGQANCTGYNSICQASGNRDITLAFKVTECPNTSTTTTTAATAPAPSGCSCIVEATSSCSTTCGAGIQTQQLNCVGSDCPTPGVTFPTVACTSNPPCTATNPQVAGAINGGWSPWNVGQCSVTCGGGSRTDTRTCTNPTPQNGGSACVGSVMQIVGCNNQACPPETPREPTTSERSPRGRRRKSGNRKNNKRNGRGGKNGRTERGSNSRNNRRAQRNNQGDGGSIFDVL